MGAVTSEAHGALKKMWSSCMLVASSPGSPSQGGEPGSMFGQRGSAMGWGLAPDFLTNAHPCIVCITSKHLCTAGIYAAHDPCQVYLSRCAGKVRRSNTHDLFSLSLVHSVCKEREEVNHWSDRTNLVRAIKPIPL